MSDPMDERLEEITQKLDMLYDSIIDQGVELGKMLDDLENYDPYAIQKTDEYKTRVSMLYGSIIKWHVEWKKNRNDIEEML